MLIKQYVSDCRRVNLVGGWIIVIDCLILLHHTHGLDVCSRLLVRPEQFRNALRIGQLIVHKFEVVMEDGVFGDIVSLALRKVVWWGEHWIHSNSKCIFQHIRNHPVKYRTASLQAWVRIDLDQVSLELTINHKVQTEYLEVVLEFCWVKEQTGCSDRISSYLFHYRVDVSHEALFTVVAFEVALELSVA